MGGDDATGIESNAFGQARVNQAGIHPTFEEAAGFFESLDLDE